MYTKLFQSIVTSSLWSEDSDTCKVWVTLLAMADKNGEVLATIPGLARVCALRIPAVEAAITKFEAPDTYSRTKDDEGKRVQPIEGGWVILNYAKYREMASREDGKRKNAERQQRFRDRQSRNGIITDRNANTEEDNARVTVTLHIAEAEAESYSSEILSEKLESSFPSSQTYVESTPTVFTPEGGKEGQSKALQKGEEESIGCSEAVFLILARKQDIDETWAKRIYLDLLGSGWKSANGTRVVSPASYLLALWNARQEHSAASPGFREPWMVDRDLKRVKDEIKRVSDDPASKNASKGKTMSQEDHQARYRADWLKVVRANHNEAKTKLPEEFAAFEASLERTREEMCKGAAMLGIPAVQSDSEDVRLEHFVDCFPNDCPNFARWDREWNKANTWKDPKGLTEEARAEIGLLKQQVALLENERRALLSNR